ncbi:MAG: methyltransferase [Terriglobia bacterium]
MAAGTMLLDMAMGYMRSRIVGAAARLRIADALANGARTVGQLASACSADPASLHRLLRALASLGIFTETAPGTFALTPLGEPLRRDVPNSQWAGVVFWADLLADNWVHLTECVKTGDKAARIMERSGLPTRWSQDPDADAIFRAVMGTVPIEQYAAIANSWDFAPWQTVADLGGGGGSLIIAVLRSFPHLQGMLVDRPASIEAAAPRFESEGLTSQCRLLAADLLEAVPAGAQVYMLKHVLHGYDDEQAVRLLKNCRSAMPRDGRVLVIEFVLPSTVNRVDPELEKCLRSDLNMLAVTGGKERTAMEWERLLGGAGLKLLRVIPVPGNTASVIEASQPGREG